MTTKGKRTTSAISFTANATAALPAVGLMYSCSPTLSTIACKNI